MTQADEVPVIRMENIYPFKNLADAEELYFVCLMQLMYGIQNTQEIIG